MWWQSIILVNSDDLDFSVYQFIFNKSSEQVDPEIKFIVKR